MSDQSTFDTFTWTIYPTRATLLRLIEHEELQLFHRSCQINANMPDPGRPPYEAFYGTLESPLPFDVHFGADFPEDVVPRNREYRFYTVRPRNGFAIDPFPTLWLICNVNVVVMMWTCALSRQMLTRASVSALFPTYAID
jgi:hypothetical protein